MRSKSALTVQFGSMLRYRPFNRFLLLLRLPPRSRSRRLPSIRTLIQRHFTLHFIPFLTSFIVKDQWRSEIRPPEGDLLSKVQNVTGIPKIVAYGNVRLSDSSVDDCKNIRHQAELSEGPILEEDARLNVNTAIDQEALGDPP